jgi:hypothetical protein
MESILGGDVLRQLGQFGVFSRVNRHLSSDRCYEPDQAQNLMLCQKTDMEGQIRAFIGLGC